MRARSGPRAIAALSVALSLIATPAAAAKDRLNPEDAESSRAEVEGRALSMSAREAVDELERGGQEFGDPELFLSAAERAYDEAESSRSPALATRAEELALVAQDIGIYLGDGGNYQATRWHPVTAERASEIASEAGALAGRSRNLAAEIEAEIAAAAAAAAAAEDEPAKEKRELQPGTGLIIGGSVALALGVAGVGMFSAGMAMGASTQREAEALAEDMLLPSEVPMLDELDRKGARANTIAIAGGAIAGVGVIVGATLIVLGVKKRKAAGPPADAYLKPSRQPKLMVDGWLDRDGGGGLTLRGSF